jgi:prepilin-type N-terminal cleavage/methylation domain-containing protein
LKRAELSKGRGPKKGFTLVELLIVMAVLAILMVTPLLLYKGMQDEARQSKAERDLRLLKLSVESYYKNHNNVYPAENDYMTTLHGSLPLILNAQVYDPFGATNVTPYVYKLATGDPSDSTYYVIYSVGVSGTGSAAVSNSGIVTSTGEVIWASNGYAP